MAEWLYGSQAIRMQDAVKHLPDKVSSYPAIQLSNSFEKKEIERVLEKKEHQQIRRPSVLVFYPR